MPFLLLLLACERESSDVEKGVSKVLAQWRKSNIGGVTYNLYFSIPKKRGEDIYAESQITFEMLEESTAYRDKVAENTAYFRQKIKELGFDVIESTHPIVAIMLYDAPLAVKVAARMLELGVYVVGFCYPVVPQGKARIRTQISAAHTKEDLDFVLEKLAQVKEEFGL